MENRIVQYLDGKGEVYLFDLIEGIKSETNQIIRTLKKLVKEGRVKEIKKDDYHFYSL